MSMFSNLKQTLQPRQVSLGPYVLQAGARFREPHIADFSYFSNYVNTYNLHRFSPVHHLSSYNNELQGLTHRLLKETPTPNPNAMRSFSTWFRANLHKVLPFNQITSKPFSTYIRRSNARPSVKRILKRTFVSLQSRGVDENAGLTHAEVVKACKRSAFVKVENLLHFNLAQGNDKAPRIIQGGTPEFITLVGPWIMAFQDYVQQQWNKDNFICFTSGLSGEQVGAAMSGDYLYTLENDVSKWDSSVGRELLNLECWMFKKFGCPALTHELIRANINTHGKTHHGIEYWAHAGRKSGDPYTSVGNSILNAMIHLWILTRRGQIPLRDVRYTSKMVVQGDDNLTRFNHFIHRQDWLNGFLDLGFDAVPISRPNLASAEFCSSRFMPNGNSHIMVPKFGRVLAKFGTFPHVPTGVNPKQMLKGVVLGLWTSLSFIPCIRQMFDQVLKDTEGIKALKPRVRDWNNLLRREVNYDGVSRAWVRSIYGDELDIVERPDKDNPLFEAIMARDFEGLKWDWC